MEESGETTYYSAGLKESPSYAFLRENNFSLLKSSKADGKHMQGPRRVLRLCMFALLLPAVLITIPLYVRIVLYPPTQYPMMPTDQRLLSRHVSSVWCQGQLTRMNGSYSAYLTPDTPFVQKDPRVHAMIHEIALGDDVKEYWGFHLLKGSRVTVSACSRFDGAQLLILRGVENLRKCAWIGEEDSAEEDDALEDAGLPDVKEKPIKKEGERGDNEEKEIEDEEEREIDGDDEQEIGDDNEEEIVDDYEKEINDDDEKEIENGGEKEIEDGDEKEIEDDEDSLEREEEITTNGGVQINKTRKGRKGKKVKTLPVANKNGPSEEQEEEEEDVMVPQKSPKRGKSQKVHGVSERPNSKVTVEAEPIGAEIDSSQERQQDLQQLLRKALHMSKGKKEILRILHSVGRSREQPLPSRIREILGVTPTTVPTRRRQGDVQRALRRQERAIGATDDDNGQEVFDDEEETSQPTKVAVKRPAEDIEKIVGGQIFLPEGLKFERGKFNQTTPNDGSNEENQSSYSSSEESLASCDGVIMTLPLVSYRSCNLRWTVINKFTYDIPVTGTYYFVFSSENEINENRLYFNLTFERVVYDTAESNLVCANKTECLVPLQFWSSERAVVEVPEETTWDHSYVLDTTCEPRVAVYLTFMLLVPVLILFCAFH